MRLYLTGFMGAGKTTIGKALSKQWNIPVVDTDELVELFTGKAIRDIFLEEGEEKFRQYETAALQSIQEDPVIITTGGGAVQKQENREWMLTHGIVLYVYCDVEHIFNRLQGDTSRPLLKDRSAFIELFQSRQAYYKQAHYQIDTTGKCIEHIVEELTFLIKER
ncbi:shikimate kinase [Ectobacillus antri]|jgi:shikimate kinase|uniref:Shikimate kinase n=1 Tax=Ectobacillus antri TaxID=2486280 RepID=A0ABT6H3W3_9BACI|nr:shikimate kinase [Ectobacillus antri]MDG4655562.1 shikimate kinase [Ectobacillus antri]MDG5753320.1 shikimate kinase [Ectobacillus antri]